MTPAKSDRVAAEAAAPFGDVGEAAMAVVAAERADAERELQTLSAYARDLEARYAAALGSPAWRALEPVRRASRFVRRRAATARVELQFTEGTWRSLRAAGAQKAEVARLAHHLWGGLSRPAAAALAAIARNPGYAKATRAEAVHKLATRQAFNGDLADALATLDLLDALEKPLRSSANRWMKEGYIRLALGDRAGSRRAFGRVLGRWPRRVSDPDAMLALSNCLADDTARLAAMNAVLTPAGLAPLALRHPERRLGLDNIRADAPAATAAGRVSVIMPAFNAAGQIETALRSLMEQTVRDLEIIVVDDASTDGTPEVVEALAREDARITLLRQASNGGAYVARNRGLAAATGDFVTTHDTDDWSHPEKIARQLAALTGAEKLAAVCCNWVRVRPDLAMTANWRIGRRIIFFSHSSLLLRRELLLELGGWDPVRIGADTDLMRRIRVLRGEASIATIMAKAPLAFARDEVTSLTRAKATHVSTVHYGLRQIYHAVARAIPPGGSGDFAARHAALPPEMFGPAEGPIELDFLLMGDCANSAVLAAMRAESTAHAGRRIGVFHWPDLAAPPADLHPDFAALLSEPGLRPVLPGAAVQLAARYPTFFGWGHADVDRPPEIIG